MTEQNNDPKPATAASFSIMDILPERIEKRYFNKPGRLIVKVCGGKAGVSVKPERLGQAFVALTFEVQSIQDGSPDYEIGEQVSFVKFAGNQYAAMDLRACLAALDGLRDHSGMDGARTHELTKNECAGLLGKTCEVVVYPNKKGTMSKDGEVFHNQRWFVVRNEAVTPAFDVEE